MIQELCNATIWQYVIIVSRIMVASFVIVGLVVVFLAFAGYITKKIIDND